MTMPDDDAYKIAAEALSRLKFRRPWSIDQFIAELSIMLGKPIVVRELPRELSQQLTGIWIPTAVHNVIQIKFGVTGHYREHLICHEIAHIVLSHTPTPEVLEQLRRAYFARLTPDLPLDWLELLEDSQPCLARRAPGILGPGSNFRHPIERQAEWLATMIMARADELRRSLFPNSLSERDQLMLRRAAAVFGWSQ